jgi:biotin operon repressor
MSMMLTARAMGMRVGNPSRKLVLLKLCDNANDRGQCWPSMQYIADHCEMSQRSVITHIAALEKDGFLTVHHRGIQGKKISNYYVITLDNARQEVSADLPEPGPSEECFSSENISHLNPVSSENFSHLSSENSARSSENISHLSSENISHKPVIQPVNKATSNKPSTVYDYPDWFESLWKIYPPRVGSNDKRKAFRAASARLKNGKSVDQLVAALERYRNFLQSSGRWGGEFVMQAATFFGPGGHVDNPWVYFSPPPRGAAGETRGRSLADDLTDRSWALPGGSAGGPEPSGGHPGLEYHR